jgi:hypothetical protein
MSYQIGTWKKFQKHLWCLNLDALAATAPGEIRGLLWYCSGMSVILYESQQVILKAEDDGLTIVDIYENREFTKTIPWNIIVECLEFSMSDGDPDWE